MLWIEKYRPTSFEGITGQEIPISRLRSWAEARNLPHLLLSGPHGTGKSAALECTARALYGDDWEVNTTFIHTAFLFGEGRPYLEAEERFSHLYRKDESVLSNVKRIVRWFASLQPLDAPFRLLVFEEAHALPHEIQQALRRMMEQYHRTCRFALCTTNPGGIIPAIASRCYPLHFLPLDEAIVLGKLREIMAAEGAEGTVAVEDLELLAKHAKGDLRRGIMGLQLMVATRGEKDLQEITGSEIRTFGASMLEFLRKGELVSARRAAETLLIEYGLSGTEVLLELSHALEREYNDPRAIQAIARAEAAIAGGGRDFMQVNALLAELIREVFHE